MHSGQQQQEQIHRAWAQAASSSQKMCDLNSPRLHHMHLKTKIAIGLEEVQGQLYVLLSLPIDGSSHASQGTWSLRPEGLVTCYTVIWNLLYFKD